ncbi:type II toxin-antitoxin system RelE/ParE family toxin [Novipirellula sp.]|uniref:type II toxin-antitoxin system RelE/ParE family toxin n=1 Tax=Novipirellula sp. TaxID=2795430 RepID=UPI00356734C9
MPRLREKCRLASQHPEIGDERPELGEGIRSIYLGNYVIFFRHRDGVVDIARIVRGDVDNPTV